LEQFSLKDKNIVITGASSGIGRQCAITCSRMGAKLLLTGRNKQALEETKKLLSNPAAADILILDLTNFDEVTKTVTDEIKKFGPVNGVIHAAGISTTLPFRNVSTAKMQEFFNVNVVAALHLTQLLIKPANISNEGASIIFITSVMSHVGESAKVLYGMTKGALLSASRSLAIELAPKKIRVNCIAPGVVDTPMSQKAYYSQNEEMKERIQSLHPLGLGRPDDVADACCFFLSDAARWITGTQLFVDGGYTAR
jgi:NAD(P)-dependent dehydrogenase (short-subunit alcohol dehydrogenase family)